MPARTRGPPRSPGSAPGFGAPQLPAPGRAGSAEGFAALAAPEPPLPSAAAEPSERVCVPLPQPLYFWERAEGHGGARRPPPRPSRQQGAPRIRPNFARGRRLRRAPGQPPAPGRHGPAGTGGRSDKAGRFSPPRGAFFFCGSGRARRGAGRGSQLHPEPPATGGASRDGSRVPAGLGSLPPRRPLSFPRVRSLSRGAAAAHPPRRPAGGIGPAGKSFPSPSPTCALLKRNEKLFPLVGFVALAKRRRPGRPGAAEPRCPPRDRALPGSRAPSPAGGGREGGGRAGGSFPGKEESGGYGKKDSAFIENFIYDSVL